MISKHLLACLLFVAMALGAVMSSPVSARRLQGGSEAAKIKEQNQAFARYGLAAAAAITGSYVKSEVAYSGEPISLEQLVAKGSNVVVGEPVTALPELTKRGDSIVTRTQFRIREVIKGTKADAIEVVLPGGRVSFSNGTWAEVRVRDFRIPRPGHNYLLVVERDALSGGSLVPCFSQLGIIEVTNLSTVPGVSADRQSSHSHFVDWLLRRNYTSGQLLADVRAIAKAE